MEYPKNRMIVNGVDLSTEFKMILADGYTLAPPQPKTYIVDIPGGNGVIDLTSSLFGDIAYSNRIQNLSFHIFGNIEPEKEKQKIYNFLHGKYFEYKLTMDPDYTYKGRFTVGTITHKVYSNGCLLTIPITISAEPFKLKENVVKRVDCIGGTVMNLDSGRMQVCPKIESKNTIKVIFNNKLYVLPSGTWNVNDIVFKEGNNEIYISSYDIKNLTWGDLKTNLVTWSKFKNKKLFEHYKSKGDGTYVMEKWENQNGKTWSDLSNKKWSDLMFLSEVTEKIEDIYIEYEWGDL